MLLCETCLDGTQEQWKDNMKKESKDSQRVRKDNCSQTENLPADTETQADLTREPERQTCNHDKKENGHPEVEIINKVSRTTRPKKMVVKGALTRTIGDSMTRQTRPKVPHKQARKRMY